MTQEEKNQKIAILWWVLNTRWLTVTPFLIFIFVAETVLDTELPISAWFFVGFPAYFYTATAVMLWLLRPSNRARISSPWVNVFYYSIVPIDLALFPVAIWQTGGFGTMLALMYFFPILFSAVFYGRMLPIVGIGGIVSLSVIAEYLLELRGYIPHLSFSAFGDLAYQDPEVVFIPLGIFTIVILGSSIVASFIARGLRGVRAEVEAEHRKLFSVVRDLRDGIIIMGSGDRIDLVNPAAEEILDVSATAVLGKFTRDLPDQNRFSTALSLEIPPFVSVPWNFTTGERIQYFRVSEVPLKALGGAEGKIRIFHNVTHEEELSRLKSRFISIAAHQLRTPLAVLKWALHMLLQGDAGELMAAQKDLAGKAYAANDRMIRLISDLLDVARIEEGRFGYTFKPTDIVALVEQLCESYRIHAQHKDLTFEFEKPQSPIPPVAIDPDRLTLVVQNVIENAVNYTLRGGVKVRLALDEEYAYISVMDTGVGIPENQKGQLFQRFFRGNNIIKLQIEGTGLGLFIARNIMRRHGGDITIQSKENVGTEVTLRLPRDAARIPKTEIPVEEAI